MFYFSEAGAYNGEDESTTLYFEQKYFLHLSLNLHLTNFTGLFSLCWHVCEHSLILFLWHTLWSYACDTLFDSIHVKHSLILFMWHTLWSYSCDTLFDPIHVTHSLTFFGFADFFPVHPSSYHWSWSHGGIQKLNIFVSFPFSEQKYINNKDW